MPPSTKAQALRFNLDPLPFEEAIAFFKAKGFSLSPDSFRDVWGKDHAQAFTVARVTAMDILEDIREEIERSLEDGISLGEFKRNLTETLARKGWLLPKGEVPVPGDRRLTPWRLETIFRTNIQSAYSAGRYKQMLEVAQDRPYWRYVAVMDGRTRPSHAALNGLIYRFDHPFWDTHTPPLGYNCRCSVVTLSARQMEERGLREETSGVDVQADPGFGYNVGKEFWKPDFNKYSPRAASLLRQELGN